MLFYNEPSGSLRRFVVAEGSVIKFIRNRPEPTHASALCHPIYGVLKQAAQQAHTYKRTHTHTHTCAHDARVADDSQFMGMCTCVGP